MKFTMILAIMMQFKTIKSPILRRNFFHKLQCPFMMIINYGEAMQENFVQCLSPHLNFPYIKFCVFTLHNGDSFYYIIKSKWDRAFWMGLSSSKSWIDWVSFVHRNILRFHAEVPSKKKKWGFKGIRKLSSDTM